MLLAIGRCACGFVGYRNFSHIIEQLQSNTLGAWGDTFIVVIALSIVTLVLPGTLLGGYMFGGMMTLVIVAAVHAQLLWVASPILLLSASLYVASQGHIPQLAQRDLAYLSADHSPCFANHLRYSPLARSFSLSKIPYQLYPNTHSLLN